MIATSALLIKSCPTKLNRLLSLLLILTLGFLIGILAFSTLDKVPLALERVDWSTEARWIGAPQPTYRFYARHDFDLTAPAQSAWLRVSADNDFILYVNGQAIAKEKNVLYNAWGLSSRLSEKFQKLEGVSYRTYGYDWLHLANARDWKITTYADLAPYLRVGKNTIALEVQKGRSNPRMVIEGYVHAVPDVPPIELTTGVAPWQLSTLYETDRDLPWFDPNFTPLGWSDAVAVGSVREKTYSRVSSHLFDRPLQGEWIAGNESATGEVQLQGEWEIEGGRGRAFVRFAGSSEYLLSIDGLLVRRFADRQLHMYDIMNFLHPGRNIVTVRLARPLARSDEGSPLEFFLDGWMELKGSVVAPFATSDRWYALLPSDLRVEQRRAAIAIRPPDGSALQRKFEGNAYWLNYPNYLWRAGLWCVGSTGLVLLAAWLLGSYQQRQHYRNWWHNLSIGTGLLLPGILFLIGIGLLKHRYAESERGITFVQSQSNSLILLGFLGVVAVTLLWSHKRSNCDRHLLGRLLLAGFGAIVATALIPSISSLLPVVAIAFSILFLLSQVPKIHWNYAEKVQAVLQNEWLPIAAIALIGFILRIYNLGFWDCEADENTSLDAIGGIMNTGAPQATSGIWYTRSPAYHYAVALWLRLIGESVVHARLFSAFWGTATLVLVFVFTRKFTPIWIAVFITALLAIDPFEIYFSRFLRFYQMVQFTSLLSFWLFFKGFVFREGKAYQQGFFVALTLTVLSQEVTITLIPCFLLGFLYFYRPFRFVDDWHLIVSSLVSLIVISFNIIFFSIKCLTPTVAISNSTDSYLRLHLFNITGLISNFFINNSRLNVIYTFFFFLGFVYFLKQRNGKLVFLFNSVLLNLIILTLLIYQVATRYAYQVYPIFIILSVYSGTVVVGNLGRYYEQILKGLLPLRNITIALLILLFIANIEPERVLAAYQDSITRRNDQVFQYISDRKQLGDMVLSPSPPGAAIYLGGLDYFLPGTVAFDVPYSHEGRVIDRWAGGVMVTNLDRLSQILEKANRVWIHMDDHAERKFSREFLQYLQVLGKPEFETFGARLRLWRKEDGVLPRVPNEGGDLGSY